MDEKVLTPTEKGNEAPVAVAPRPDMPSSLDLKRLQTMSQTELDDLCRRMDVRKHPGRSRHHEILDIVRCALSQNVPVTTEGFYEQVAESFGLLRSPALNFLALPEDVAVPRATIQQFKFRPGQLIAGTVRLPREREKSLMLDEVTRIEGIPAAEWQEPTAFDNLTPLFPEGRIFLENSKTNSIEARAIDLLTPLGKGQRGLIVAPPRVGKTILLKEIAKAIRANHPEIVLIILLVDERPEEATDLQREVDCQIYTSTFDEPPLRHVQVSEMVLERAKRLVEQKKDVVVLLDSITRLARGYNAHAGKRPHHVRWCRIESVDETEEVLWFGPQHRRRRQSYHSGHGADRYRQQDGPGHLRGIQRHGKHGAASRPFVSREASLSYIPSRRG